MLQLNNQDAGFVYHESNETPMHIAGIGIYAYLSHQEENLEQFITKFIQKRIHLLPELTQKYQQVPFNLDKPYWVQDKNFDLQFHIRHLALAKPGNWQQLTEMISRLHAKPLDFKKPLWEIYIIEGLNEPIFGNKPCYALMFKIHHAIVDGIAAQGLFATLHDLTIDAAPPEPPAYNQNQEPQAAISGYSLLQKSLPQLIKRPIEQTTHFYQKAPKIIRGLYKSYQGQLKSGTKLKVPQTQFNQKLSSQRVFNGIEVSLDKIKAIKNTLNNGVTVNDVVLCIISGGLRHYLKQQDLLPAESLSAMIPQNIRHQVEESTYGNQVGGLFALIHSDINNPVARLLAIHESTDQAKSFSKALASESIFKNYMGGFLTPTLGKQFNKWINHSGIKEFLGPFACNTLISNVAGPQFPLFQGGAELKSFWGLPPLTHGIGLGHAVFSYNNNMTISFLSCKEMMLDPDNYTQCLMQSFNELTESILAKKNDESVNNIDQLKAG